MEAENIEFVVTLSFALLKTAPLKLGKPPSRVQLDHQKLLTDGKKSPIGCLKSLMKTVKLRYDIMKKALPS